MDHPSIYPDSATTPSGATLSTRSTDTSLDDQSDISKEQLRQGHSSSSNHAVVDEQFSSLGLVPAFEAWQLDVSELLDSKTFIPPMRPGQRTGNNFKSYNAKKSVFVLCVLGNIDIHLHFLCDLYEDLILISPTIQILIITDRIEQVKEKVIPSLLLTFPVLEAKGTPPNHFLKLGLLQPNDSQNRALDAIVLIDPDGKRRLVLPFGWGAGKYITDHERGKRDLERLATVLKESLKQLVEEKNTTRGSDFYEIAKTYF